MKKKLKHAYVTLVDLPEALTFGYQSAKEYTEAAQMEEDQKKQEEGDKKLFAFVDLLQSGMNEEFVFIGDDMIGEKFYKRFLFEKGGFVEIMTGVPIAISAHFTGLARAKTFADVLSKALEKTVENQQIAEILKNTLVVNEEEAYKLTYETWDKMRQVREGE